MKKIIASFLCTVMLTGVCQGFTVFAQDNVIEIFVAPDGDDSAAGTIDAPLKSLQGAKDKVASLKKDNVPVNVYFRGGVYHFTDTVKFGKSDSGTPKAPITYMAYEDEKPKFSGGVKIETEDFKRVEGEMYERLPQISRDFVGVVDLKKKGVNSLTKFTAVNVTSDGISVMEEPDETISIEDVNAEFYFNDRSMTLAEWPNGSDNWSIIEKVHSNWELGVNTNGRMKNWLTAENPIMGGYPRVAWTYVEAPIKEFDTENERLIFQRPYKTDKYEWGRFTPGVIGDPPREGYFWKIQNLVEELDVPGEFYIDYDTMELYFYPPYSTVGVDMYVASGERILVDFEGITNITFKGITFEKNREDLVSMYECEDMKFLSCTFRHTASTAIQMVDKCRSILIDGCDFDTFGVSGVYINHRIHEKVDVTDDDAIELKPQNNIVNNCEFWNVATQLRGYTGAVKVHGVGNQVTNCRIHEAKSGVIYWKGNDHKINNNEIYNVLKVAKDQGAVYNGRSVVYRGTEMAFNHFHDMDTSSEEAGYIHCIYNDDALGATQIHHNLFIDIESPYNLAGGTDTKVDYNIVARSERAGIFASQGWEGSQFQYSYNDFRRYQLPDVYTLEAYKKYENMHRIFFGTSWPVYGASYKGNMFFQNDVKLPQLNEGVINQGISFDDIYVYEGNDYKEVFNNPDNGDFTIKEDYKLPEGFEGLKEIKLENIGLYESETRKSINRPLSDFKLYYPYNFTEKVSGREVFLSWEESIGADEYVVEIALDKEFTKLAGSYTAQFNYLLVDDLDNDLTEYFWRVKAVAKGKDCKEEKYNYGGPRHFRTQEFDVLDKTLLVQTLEKAHTVLSQVTEGVEEGNIAYGSTKNLKHHIKTGETLIENKKGLQSEIDTIVNLLEKEMSNIGKTVAKYYSGINNIIEAKDSWVNNTAGNGLSYIDNGIMINNTSDKEMVCYTNVAAPIQRNRLFCFKMNVSIPDGASGGVWQAIAFQPKEDAGKIIYSAGARKYGYLFIIKNDVIEVQIWNGSQQRIVGNIPNTIPKGVDTDIKFGVLDFGAGQQIILEIDGETVFDHSEYQDLLREDLYFCVYDQLKKEGALNCNPIQVKSVAVDDIPTNDIHLGNKLSLGTSDLSEAIKSVSGSNELKMLKGVKVCKVNMEDLKALEFNIKPKLTNDEQGVIFRLNNSDFDENKSNYYKLSFKNNKLILRKNIDGKKQTMSIITTDAVKSGEWNNIKIYNQYQNSGSKIIVYVNGAEVINCIDVQPIQKEGYFGVFNNSSSELLVKP